MARVSAGRDRGDSIDPIVVPGPGKAPYAHRDPAADAWMEKLAWLMDRSIPLGGNLSIGLDGILGLVPGVGDLFSGAISSMIIVQAERAGLPRATILRMVANVGIDAIVGAVPLLGDLFDFAFKANTKNLELYKSAIKGERRAGRDARFLLVVLLLLVVAVAIPILLIAWAVQFVWSTL